MVFKDHRPSKKPLLTFKPSLRRRTKAPQKRYTVTRRVPRTRTTSSLCLMPLPTSSSLTTYEDVASTEDAEQHGTVGLAEMSYIALGGRMLWDTSAWKLFWPISKVVWMERAASKICKGLGLWYVVGNTKSPGICGDSGTGTLLPALHHCLILVDWRLLVECEMESVPCGVATNPSYRGVHPLTFMKFNVIIIVSNFIAIMLIITSLTVSSQFCCHHHHQCWCCLCWIHLSY